ncbi:hypothetical protein GO988_14445 [Hymenobacter sp. HMF4947]|uniref:Uncharacterized protein n=1 Tax=Hymenobacter ginkgonis TaxID=2682976 RepID=A0A7K1TGU1_9BACT|nr:hypothetical protein [Hymenobacter ginkgonis]MVN77532.1 hypothetical protein [Hymenobacter ginkgonis]
MTQIYSFLQGVLLLAVAGNSLTAHAQGVGIGGAPNAAAALDIISTTKGLLLPRLTNTQMQALPPVVGMVVYNTDQAGFYGYQASKATNAIEQIAASSTSAVSLNQKQYAGSLTQSFTAVATSFEYATVYGSLSSFNGYAPTVSSSAILQATFSIKNSSGVVVGSADGSFALSPSATALTLNLPVSGLVVGQTYTFTITRQDDNTAGFALTYSSANPYAGGVLYGLSTGDLAFQLGSYGHLAGWAPLTR